MRREDIRTWRLILEAQDRVFAETVAAKRDDDEATYGRGIEGLRKLRSVLNYLDRRSSLGCRRKKVKC